ncbi:hypothetical protein KY284_022400 [Solanum tuberosum]|nr:hypothetical protein KY284_022400 [Solanum tuberosum]
MGDSLPSDGSTTPTTIGTASTSAERVVLDTSHPFFLHASDSPGMIPVSTIFDGKGYGGWRRGILIALSAKNKVGFIDGSIIPPSIPSESHRYWSRCNNMVISWLLNSLSKEIAESVLYSKTTKHIWEELEEKFGQSNGPLLYQLQKEISELAQGNLDIATYYTKLKRLWDELDSLDICQACTCDCSCGGKAKTHKSEQDGRLIQFLIGLNEAYSRPRSNLLLLSPLPSVNYAYSLLIRDEKQREVQISQHSSVAAFYASKQPYVGQNYGDVPPNYIAGSSNNVTGPSNYVAGPSKQHSSGQKFTSDRRVGTEGKKNVSGLFCSYCKRTNHTIDNCYRLIGFPADFKFTKSKRMGAPAKSNAAYSNEEAGNSSGDRPMTQDQYHNLYQLLQHVKLGSDIQNNTEEVATANCAGITSFTSPRSYSTVSVNSVSWILDSGASEHMTSNFGLLFDVKMLPKPIYVDVLNFTRALVFKSGSVSLFPGYTIHHVLFGPSMKRPLVLGCHDPISRVMMAPTIPYQ